MPKGGPRRSTGQSAREMKVLLTRKKGQSVIFILWAVPAVIFARCWQAYWSKCGGTSLMLLLLVVAVNSRHAVPVSHSGWQKTTTRMLHCVQSFGFCGAVGCVWGVLWLGSRKSKEWLLRCYSRLWWWFVTGTQSPQVATQPAQQNRRTNGCKKNTGRSVVITLAGQSLYWEVTRTQ